MESVMKNSDSVFVVAIRPVSERISAIRKGFAASDVETVSEDFHLNKKELISFLGLADRTAARLIKEQRRLAPPSSERLLRLVDMSNYAQEVLGDREQGLKWLLMPNSKLGDSPFNLLDTDLGAAQVRAVLAAIEHGLPV